MRFPKSEKIVLEKIPFETQLDNWGQEHRTCNTSSCWMFAQGCKPGILEQVCCSKKDNADFKFYLPIVNSFGDTTQHFAQTLALRELGVESEWRTDLTIEKVADEICKGYPVVIGILHKYEVSWPGGFGHMICVVGFETDELGNVVALIVHDPYGELRLVTGGYQGMPEDGAFLRYSVKNLRPRFEVDNSGHLALGNGWGRVFVG